MAQDLIKNLTIMASLVSVLLPSHPIYASQFGPPEPVASEGNVVLGMGYFHFSGILNPNKRGSFIRQHDIERNQVYLQAGYGFVTNWEAYLGVGGSDLKIDNAFPLAARNGSSDIFNDSFNPFGTFGLKGLLYDGSYFGIGLFFQASLFPNYKDKTKYRGFDPACEVQQPIICGPLLLQTDLTR